MSLLHLSEIPMGKVEAGLYVTLIEEYNNNFEVTEKQAARKCARELEVQRLLPFALLISPWRASS